MNEPQKRPLDQRELKAALNEQLGLLEDCAAAFDAGRDAHYKLIAVGLRKLLHDNSRSGSISLLTQLGLKDLRFVDTAIPFDPKNLMSHCGLAALMLGGGPRDYLAMLDDAPVQAQAKKFEDWWTDTVFRDMEGHVLCREDLVRTAADQDGGAHVDANLDGVYGAIARDNALGWRRGPVTPEFREAEMIPLGNPIGAAIRQIAHEVLKTLKPGYAKKPNLTGYGPASFGITMRAVDDEEAETAPRPRKIGRNELCWCGAPKKFKHCHGK